MTRTRRGPDIQVKPITNADGLIGPDPDALRELGIEPEGNDAQPRGKSRPRESVAPEPPPTSSTATKSRASPTAPPPPAKSPDAAPGPSRTKPRGGRVAKENRVQRAIRLTQGIDSMLKSLAKFQGIDLNAAVSVAIAAHWGQNRQHMRESEMSDPDRGRAENL
jgi:hypothetical protein